MTEPMIDGEIADRVDYLREIWGINLSEAIENVANEMDTSYARIELIYWRAQR